MNPRIFGAAIDTITELTARPDVIRSLREPQPDFVYVEETVDMKLGRHTRVDYLASTGIVFAWLSVTHGILAPVWWTREIATRAGAAVDRDGLPICTVCGTLLVFGHADDCAQLRDALTPSDYRTIADTLDASDFEIATDAGTLAPDIAHRVQVKLTTGLPLTAEDRAALVVVLDQWADNQDTDIAEDDLDARPLRAAHVNTVRLITDVLRKDRS